MFLSACSQYLARSSLGFEDRPGQAEVVLQKSPPSTPSSLALFIVSTKTFSSAVCSFDSTRDLAAWRAFAIFPRIFIWPSLKRKEAVLLWGFRPRTCWRKHIRLLSARRLLDIIHHHVLTVLLLLLLLLLPCFLFSSEPVSDHEYHFRLLLSHSRHSIAVYTQNLSLPLQYDLTSCLV